MYCFPARALFSLGAVFRFYFWLTVESIANWSKLISDVKQMDGSGRWLGVSGSSFASDCARCVIFDLITVYRVASVRVSVKFWSCDTVFFLCNFKTFWGIHNFCFWTENGETNPNTSDVFFETSVYLCYGKYMCFGASFGYLSSGFIPVRDLVKITGSQGSSSGS